MQLGETLKALSRTYTSVNEYQYEACPAGFTYNGSGQVPNQVRTVTTYYIGGTQVGQSTSAWYDIDADCSTMEYQQIPCPTNYTGVYYQSRQVIMADGDSLQYGTWTTYGNSCVYVSPEQARQIDNSNGVTIHYGHQAETGFSEWYNVYFFWDDKLVASAYFGNSDTYKLSASPDSPIIGVSTDGNQYYFKLKDCAKPAPHWESQGEGSVKVYDNLPSFIGLIPYQGGDGSAMPSYLCSITKTSK